MAEYEIFVANDLSDLKEGEDQIVKVRNMVNVLSVVLPVPRGIFSRSLILGYP